MKKKLILIASLVFVICCLFAITANAECVEHTDNWAVNLGAEGFLGELEAVNVCPVCGTHFASETIAPLFETYGYSYKEDTSSITQHFAVNRAALARYEELSGDTVKFGAVIASKDAAADGNLIDADGNPTANGVLVADVTGRKYDVFEVKLVNIPAEAFEGRYFYSCAYVISGGSVTYLENGVETVKVTAKDVKNIKTVTDDKLFDTPALEPVKVVGGARYEKQEWNDDGALKVLTIGNSFSDDATEYLYDIAKAAGISNVVVGNLRANSCSLATHLSNAKEDKGAYMFRYWANGATYFTDYGSWTSGTYKMKDAVTLENWDYIVFQQVSTSSTNAATYDDLNNLIGIVEALNPTAKFAWHMTWSRPDYTDGSMYNGIVNAVQEKILTNEKIDVVIPAGTAIENARTSYLADVGGIYRNNPHLSYGVGRYIAAMTFVNALTGKNISNIEYAPADTAERDPISLIERLIAIEAVNNAAMNPYEVTQSAVTSSEHISQLSEVDYLGLMKWSFYNSTVEGLSFEPITADKASEAGITSFVYANDPVAFYSTKMFTRETLPVGSVIVLRPIRSTSSGTQYWKYIVDGWTDPAKVSETRAEYTTAQYILVTEAWWGNDTVKAISLTCGSLLSGGMHQNIRDLFDVLVPASALELNVAGSTAEPQPTRPGFVPDEDKVAVEDEEEDAMAGKVDPSKVVDEITVIDGKKYRALTMEEMGLVIGFYNSSSGSHCTTNGRQDFAATRMFTKDDLLNGMVIWVNSGKYYKPEGWFDLNETNARNENCYQTYTVITDEWWSQRYNGTEYVDAGGTYEARAFNTGRGSDSLETVYSNFKIYVPVELIYTPKISEDKVVDEITVINGKEYRALTMEEMGLVIGFYNSSSGSHCTTNGRQDFAATRVFTKDDLLNGMVIWVNSGKYYKPEGWFDLNETNARNENCYQTYTFITDEWWSQRYNGTEYVDAGGTYEARAFNTGRGSDSLETVYSNFKIYVPVELIEGYKQISAEKVVDEITVIDGKEYRALTKEEMGLVIGFYNSSSGSHCTTNGRQDFAATRMFTKDDLLNGFVIWVNSGKYYKPEGWFDLNETNARNENCYQTYTVITDEWWSQRYNGTEYVDAGGTYEARAFNTGRGSDSLDTVYSNFKIYVPVQRIAD